MSIYLIVPLVLLVVIVQVSAMPYLTLFGVFADLPLIVVASWSLLRGAREGAVWALTAGLALDLLSGAPMGAATVSMLAVAVLAVPAQGVASRARLLLPLAVVFGGTVVYDLVFLLVMAASGRPVVWLQDLVRIVLPSAAFNTLLTPAVYWPSRWLHRRFGREEMAW